MTSLPRSRPVRRSSKRAERASDDAPTSRTGATRKPKSTKAKAAAKPKAKPAATAAATAAREPRATPRPRPAAAEPRRTPRPKPAAAEPRSVAAGAQATAEPAPHVARPGEPFVAPKRKIPAAGYAAPSSRDADHESAVADLLTTTVQAAHELAQIGVDVGRAAMRSMLDRLPKA